MHINTSNGNQAKRSVEGMNSQASATQSAHSSHSFETAKVILGCKRSAPSDDALILSEMVYHDPQYYDSEYKVSLGIPDRHERIINIFYPDKKRDEHVKQLKERHADFPTFARELKEYQNVGSVTYDYRKMKEGRKMSGFEINTALENHMPYKYIKEYTEMLIMYVDNSYIMFYHRALQGLLRQLKELCDDITNTLVEIKKNPSILPKRYDLLVNRVYSYCKTQAEQDIIESMKSNNLKRDNNHNLCYDIRLLLLAHKHYMFYIQVALAVAIEQNDHGRIQEFISYLEEHRHYVRTNIKEASYPAQELDEKQIFDDYFKSTDALSPISFATERGDPETFDQILSMTIPHNYPTDIALIKAMMQGSDEICNSRLAKLLKQGWNPNLIIHGLLDQENAVSLAINVFNLDWRLFQSDMYSHSVDFTTCLMNNKSQRGSRLLLSDAISSSYPYTDSLMIASENVWDSLDSRGWNILHKICLFVRIDLLKTIYQPIYFEKIKALINTPDLLGRVPFNLICSPEGRCTMLSFLIKAGMDIHYRPEETTEAVQYRIPYKGLERLSVFQKYVEKLDLNTFPVLLEYIQPERLNDTTDRGNNLFHLVAIGLDANSKNPSKKHIYLNGSECIDILLKRIDHTLLSQENQDKKLPYMLLPKDFSDKEKMMPDSVSHEQRDNSLI
ncbi:MAG: hypothetical protein HAW62_01165 [Endozoicomonadaceae bacterium]|nr:hypothetical protein [Endozoicomonadaceae bacterium]